MRHAFRIRRAFTLIELLVVVAIIAALISILVPSLNKSKEQALNAVCGSNQKQKTTATVAYGVDNRGMLFDDQVTQSVPSYLVIDPIDEFTRMYLGNQPEVFYCPLYLRNNWWSQKFTGTAFAVDDEGRTSERWEFWWRYPDWKGFGSRLLGYCYLNDPSLEPAANQASNENYRPQRMTDSGTLALWVCPNFRTHVNWDGTENWTHWDDLAREPKGGNNAYLDGSVQWTPYSRMTVKYSYNLLWRDLYW